MAGQAPSKLLITIDGPAGAGKSSVARALAARLGYVYLESGRLYRAVGWKVLQEGLDPRDISALERFCGQLEISVKGVGGELRVFVDHKDVTDELKTPVLDELSSILSAAPPVRKRLLQLQREIGRRGGVVAEGRDMGSVVFPEAPLKFYLDASPQVRAERRWQERRRKGQDADLGTVAQETDSRDRRDRERELAPLQRPEDAEYLDTSDLTLDQVVATILGKVHGITGPF